MKPKQLLLITVSLLVLVLGIFVLTRPQSPNTLGKPKLAATIFPAYDIVKNIAGDKFEVVQIMPSEVSAHTYEPSIEDQQKLSGSKVIFKIGQKLDDWIVALAENNASNATKIDLDRNIKLLAFEEHEEDAEQEEGADHGEEHGEFDPHYWVSPLNAIIMAQTVTAELIKIDPANSQYYNSQLSEYTERLNTSFEQAKKQINSLNDKKIITFHEAFSYFAQDLGLEVLTTIEPFPGKEPTVAYLEEVSNTIDTFKVKALFKEPQLSDTVLRSLAEDKGASIYTLDPLGGVEGRNSYISNFEYNVETIVNALD